MDPLTFTASDQSDKKRPGSSVTSKDLILANHTSYLDILYLAYRYSPQFTSISKDGLQVAPISLREALAESITGKQIEREVRMNTCLF